MPQCEIHKVDLVKRSGQFGEFYSCPTWPKTKCSFKYDPKVKKDSFPTQEVNKLLDEIAEPLEDVVLSAQQSANRAGTVLTTASKLHLLQIVDELKAYISSL